MSEEDSPLEKLTLLELVEDVNARPHLKTVLKTAYKLGICPYATVGDYVRSDMDREGLLLRIPNFGEGLADIFMKIVLDAIHSDSYNERARQLIERKRKWIEGRSRPVEEKDKLVEEKRRIVDGLKKFKSADAIELLIWLKIVVEALD